jgi:predicted nucleic acid-binding protein
MSGRAFVDTGALLALAGTRDQYHRRARAIAERHVAGGGVWVGTTLVLAELHGLLVKRAGPDAAQRSLAALLDDPICEWLEASQDLVRSALAGWIERFRDHPFTLTDAVSFEVMRRKRIKYAFAFDGHFVTAGFQLLG